MLFCGRDSVAGISKGWTVLESNPRGREIFRTRPDRPWAHPASYVMGTVPGLSRV
jgi:hypothetical protein